MTTPRVFVLIGTFIRYHAHVAFYTFIRVVPLRSPMSIFSKSPDLEKCEAEERE